MTFQKEITDPTKRPYNFRDQADISPETLEKLMLWLDRRLNGLETRIASLESRVTVLENAE